MIDVADMTCEACRKGSPAVTAAQLEQFRDQILEWRIVEVEEVKQLTRTYAFDDFAGALAFTNKVGELAEAENHHPAILTEWGKVTVSWWTHVIGGLHINDFILLVCQENGVVGLFKQGPITVFAFLDGMYVPFQRFGHLIKGGGHLTKLIF